MQSDIGLWLAVWFIAFMTWWPAIKAIIGMVR
jgi:hypothetical protein